MPIAGSIRPERACPPEAGAREIDVRAFHIRYVGVRSQVFSRFLSALQRPRRVKGFGTAAKDAPPLPDRPLAVIGDVHGCHDLLLLLLARLRAKVPAALPVLVGDVIDRGPGSRAVLEYLAAAGDGVVVVRGNHEQMMIDFLDAPTRNGERWFRNGGLQTLDSFGIRVSHQTPGEQDLLDTRAALQTALGSTLESWLRRLPLWWRSGNVVVTHAGADPRTRIGHQNPRHLLWGHPGFGVREREDRLWIVHGHTIVRKPVMGAGIISVDTGAYTTGLLSAALISRDGVTFETAYQGQTV